MRTSQGLIMSSLLLILLLSVMISGCAEAVPTPSEQAQINMREVPRWIHGPMMDACIDLPGPESQRACRLVSLGALGQLRGDHLSRADQFRIELAKARGTDETLRLWTKSQQESWLRGPRTNACKLAPVPLYAQRCLDSIEQDLNTLRKADQRPNVLPAIRAERAVARLEARERQRLEQQAKEVEVVLEVEGSHELRAVGMGGGLFGSSTASKFSEVSLPPVVQMPVIAPLRPTPPVYCTSRKTGSTTSSDCY